jgi:hypothetical protein
MAGPYTSSTRRVARAGSELVAVQFLGKPESDRPKNHEGSDFHLNLLRRRRLEWAWSMGVLILKKRDESTFCTEYLPQRIDFSSSFFTNVK